MFFSWVNIVDRDIWVTGKCLNFDKIIKFIYIIIFHDALLNNRFGEEYPSFDTQIKMSISSYSKNLIA